MARKKTTAEKLEALNKAKRAGRLPDAEKRAILETLERVGRTEEERKRIEEEQEQALKSLGSLLKENGFESADELLDQLEVDGEPATDAARKLLRSRRAENNVVTVKHPRALHYPTDKPNAEAWNLLEERYTNGQFAINFDTGKRKRDNALVFYSIYFDGLDDLPSISKRLTPYDKRVYIAVASLYKAGNTIVSLSQIAKMMGINRTPNKSDLDKINQSLTKMRAAIIYISNAAEIAAKYKKPRFDYDGSLLPFERTSAYINGQLTEGAVHIFREPPLFTFAAEREQVTTITRKCLETGLNMTDSTLRLEDFLIRRISWIKNDKTAPRRITLADIYEECGITTKMQRSRLPEKARTLLKHYKKTGFISDYEEEQKEYIIDP